MAVFIIAFNTRVYWSWHFHSSSGSGNTRWYNIKLVFCFNSRHFWTSHKYRTMWFFLDFWNIFSRINHSRITVTNIPISRSTKFLRTVHFQSRSRTAKWLRSVFAVMVWNGENGSTHYKFFFLWKGHGSIFSSASTNTRKDRTIHNFVQIKSWWRFGYITILAISKTISGTILGLGLTPNITGRLRGTHTIETMLIFLDWVTWVGYQLVSHSGFGLGQRVSLQFVGSKIIFSLDVENGSNSVLGFNLDRSGSPQRNGVFWHLLVWRVPSFHFFTHFGL